MPWTKNASAGDSKGRDAAFAVIDASSVEALPKPKRDSTSLQRTMFAVLFVALMALAMGEPV